MSPILGILLGAAAWAGSSTAAQLEVELGPIRAADVYGAGTDERTRFTKTGLAVEADIHASLVGAVRGDREGLVVQDWWGGEFGLGGYLGREPAPWGEYAVDFGARFGTHSDEMDLYVTPRYRGGMFRPAGGSAALFGNGVGYNAFGVHLAFRQEVLLAEIELPMPHTRDESRSWGQRASIAVGFGEATKHLLRWELTATGHGADRSRLTTLMYVLRVI